MSVYCLQSRSSFVELNRYAAGAGEWIGISPRFVSCERDALVRSGCVDWSKEIDLHLLCFVSHVSVTR